jgi:hypothetical protein
MTGNLNHNPPTFRFPVITEMTETHYHVQIFAPLKWGNFYELFLLGLGWNHNPPDFCFQVA